MKKVGPKHIVRCSWCDAQAKWKSNTLTANKAFACSEHKQKLKAYEDEHSVVDDGHMSEADYQTWGRL